MNDDRRFETIRTETSEKVRSIWLARPESYNTITPTLRDELALAIDDANADPAVHVILLRAEGKAFCAGYGLDWSTAAQASELEPNEDLVGKPPGLDGPAKSDVACAASDRDGFGGRRKVWDSVSDLRMINTFVDTYLKLWYSAKPTVAAVNGWCIGGGTDMVLCADLIIAGDDAVFGYPPARVWGTPTTAMWVYRMGLEKAKRYLLTGDEISGEEAARIGLVLECVPAAELQDRAFALARRMAMLPTNQLVMLKLLCNQTVENMGFASSRLLGSLFDGIARHTQEGLDFVRRAQEVGFRQAVYERDDPFGDYGSGPRGSRARS
ncbi:MAG: crotonase/enoyl-CoA hydratase family protein [Acidimicrobiales bacterium]|nr:crotonase/enoyl-CoA hydratase family protein [Acidimicrobiales bacterium]